MNKLVKLGLLTSTSYVIWSYGAIAQQIPSFPSATVPFSGGEQTYLVQGGASKNMTLNQLATWAGPITPSVTTLRQACTSATSCSSGSPIYASGVMRLSFSGTLGDATPVTFLPDVSGVCATDDGGYCVSSANSGFWLAQYVTIADVREWGAPTGGGSDASSAIQAAINISAGTGLTLMLGPYTYLVNTPLTSSGSVHIQGTYTAGQGYATCALGQPNGSALITTNASSNLLTLTGITPSVRNVCFQGATGATAGTLLTMGGTSSLQQRKGIVEHNTFIGGFAQLDIGGNTTGATQTNGDIVDNNTFYEPSHSGIRNGLNSTNESTAGIYYNNNQLTGNASGNSAIGFALYDGAITAHMNNIGPYGWNIGTLVFPGTGQTASAQFTGVVGDTPVGTNSHALLIDSNGGTVEYFNCSQCWAANNTGSTGPAVLIQDTAASSKVHHIQFTGSTFHGANETAGGQNIIDIEGDAFGILGVGNLVTADGGGTADTGLFIGGTAQDIDWGYGSFLQVGSAHLTNAIVLAGSGDIFSFIGNRYGNATNQLVVSGWTSTNLRMVYSLGSDETGNVPNVASAASIAAPLNTNAFFITGTGSISNMTNFWAQRRVFMTFTNAAPGAIASGGVGTSKFINSLTPTSNETVEAWYSTTNSGWYVK